MALFKKPTEPETMPASEPEPSRPGARKAAPTPTRREAEAARRARMNPQLSPQEAKRRNREAQMQARQRATAEQESAPHRQLVRDVVDSRFNPAEIALPILMLMMVAVLIPALQQWANWFLYLSWAYILFILVDAALMWRRVKRLLAERVPVAPVRGLMMYGVNRQMTFRRWRQPPPRVKRGDAV